MRFMNCQFALKEAICCCDKLVISQNHAFQKEKVFSDTNKVFNLDCKPSSFLPPKKAKKWLLSLT